MTDQAEAPPVDQPILENASVENCSKLSISKLQKAQLHTNLSSNNDTTNHCKADDGWQIVRSNRKGRAARKFYFQQLQENGAHSVEQGAIPNTTCKEVSLEASQVVGSSDCTDDEAVLKLDSASINGVNDETFGTDIDIDMSLELDEVIYLQTCLILIFVQICLP